MPTDIEWKEAFERINRGETSYRDEGKGLGVNPSTFQRHYLNYLESRVGLVREEHARLEGAVASTTEKLDGLSERYTRKDQELAGECAQKKRAAEAEFQSALKSLRMKLAREEARLQESLTKKEREGERRLKKIDAEVDAKNAVIVEFRKRGLEPTRGLELLKEHEDLRGELSRKGGILKSVNSSIDERKRQWCEEERDATSKRKEAAKRWDETLEGKRRQNDELDRHLRERKEQEKRLKEGFEHGVSAEFFKALHNLNSEDRLTILRYGLASCTYHEAETLYHNDLNRRLDSEISKIRQGMIKDLMREFQ